MIIIDGPNLMHKQTHNRWKDGGDVEKVDVYILLVVIRYFLRNKFIVIVFLPQKYTLPQFTNNPTAIKVSVDHPILSFHSQQLTDLGLIHVTNYHHDDKMCIELAARTNGVIITQDQFR